MEGREEKKKEKTAVHHRYDLVDMCMEKTNSIDKHRGKCSGDAAALYDVVECGTMDCANIPNCSFIKLLIVSL